MCTLTIHRTAHRTVLTVNRDELVSRAPEVPPSVKGGEGETQWIAPDDGARGGTWIGVNEHGLIACLMNGNVPLEEARAARRLGGPSRGEIVPGVLQRTCMTDALDEIQADGRFGAFPAFQLYLADTNESHAMTWWGESPLEHETLPGTWELRISSPWRTEEVAAWRREAFSRWIQEGARWEGGWPGYHLYRPEGAEAFAPNMDRGYACTRSITQVDLNAQKNEAVMRYAGIKRGIPCEATSDALPLRLLRRDV